MTDPELTTPLVRRTFSAAFKAQIVAECADSKASVEAAALEHSIHPALINKWIRQHKHSVREQDTKTSFIPVPIGVPSTLAQQAITITVNKSAMAVTINWPISVSNDCAAWLRKWLQ